jgi:hypothetical protein
MAAKQTQSKAPMSKAIQLAESWTTLPSIKIRELVRSVVEKVVVQDEKVVRKDLSHDWQLQRAALGLETR